MQHLDIANDQGYAVYYKGTAPGGRDKDTVIPGTFTLTWKRIATDEDGDPVDISLKCSSMHTYGATNQMFIWIDARGWVETQGFAFDIENDTWPGARGWFDAEYSFYKSEPAEDGSLVPATGNWVLQFNDLDVYGNNDWSETIILRNNYESDIHLIPNDMRIDGRGVDIPGCWLTITGLNGDPKFQASKDRPDNNTLHTGFCISARNDFKFSWWGSGCGTVINNIYGQQPVEATSTEGGDITSKGITEIPWKHNKIYTATADKHHYISKALVDGEETEIGGHASEYSYEFVEVIKPHTIHVEFAPYRHAIIYDANTGNDGFSGDTPSTEHDAGTDAPIADNGFIRSGYRFIGWNTYPDGTGIAYEPGDEMLIDVEDITLYAQWEKLLSVTFMDEDGTIYAIDGSVPIGGSSTPPIPPTRQGYTFAGWAGIYTDVQKDEIVVASWAPNQYTIIYEPNGGEGVHMLDQEMLYNEEGMISDSSYTRHNYEFIGWNTQPDGNGESYVPDDAFMSLTAKPDGKVYLYAQWEFYIKMPETGSNAMALLALAGAGALGAALTGALIRVVRRKDK